MPEALRTSILDSVNGQCQDGDVSDPSLEPAIRALYQLPPQAQELIISMVHKLAEQHGIAVAHALAPGLQTPIQGLASWQAYMVGQNFSKRTVKLYTHYVKGILSTDPIPTSLSIQSYLANELRRGVSPGVVHDKLKSLKSFFGFLHDHGLWSPDPTAGTNSPKLPKREREIPSEEDVFKLLATAKKPKSRAWLTLLVDTGARYDEIARLTWDNVDYENREIQVIGKGNKERSIPISPTTIAVLTEYRQTLDGSSGRVFPSNDSSGAWNSTAANRMIARLCRKAGIKKITNHQLRHFVATYLLEHGGEGALKSVSELLGHANTAVTVNYYIHTDKKKIRRLHQQHGPLTAMARPLLEGGDS